MTFVQTGPGHLEATFQHSSGFTARVTIDEDGQGKLVFTVEVTSIGGVIGDLRALYWDFTNNLSGTGVQISALDATGSQITDERFKINSVSDLGGGTSMSGSVLNEYGKFDAGVEFGTQGIGQNDIQSTTFVLSANVPLTLEMVAYQDMGLRVTSVGEDGECRTGSLKLGTDGAIFIPDPPPEPEDGSCPGGVTETLMQETFSSGSNLAASGNVVSSAFYGSNGQAVTDGTTDGALLFRTVDLSQHDDATLTLDAKVLNGGFEAWGTSGGDVLRVELIDQNGNVILLDQFSGTGNTLYGSATGQSIGLSGTTLTYAIPEGVESFQLRISSDISYCTEIIALDNVKVTAVTEGCDTGGGGGGGGTPPVVYTLDAIDDAFSVGETQDIAANLLTNDTTTAPSGMVVTGVDALGAQNAGLTGESVGTAFSVTTAGGRTGTVTVNADGTFSFDGGDNFRDLTNGQTDSFQLSYTVRVPVQDMPKHNLLFVLDISNSTVNGNGTQQDVFVGTGVGDVNGDGLSDTVLDAQIQGVIAAIQNLLAQGVDPSKIDVGIVTFSGAAQGFTTIDAATLGTFAIDSAALISTLTGITRGGWTNYEEGLQEARTWFAGQQGDGAVNKMYFLSDGRPAVNYVNGQYVYQSMADYGDEITAIRNTYNAEVHAIGVGANSDLGYLNDLDNTGGAQQVLDTTTLTAVLEDTVATLLEDTATVTVTINGEGFVVDARDDSFSIGETQDIDAAFAGPGGQNSNIIDDDLVNGLPAGPGVLTVTGIATVDGGATTAMTVGQSFTVTTAGGRTGTVTVNADGSFSFDGGTAFEGLNDGQTDSFRLAYTVTKFAVGPNILVNGDFESHGALTRGGSGGNFWNVFESIAGWYTPVGVLEIQDGTHHGTPFNPIGNAVLEVDSHDSDDTNASVVQDVTLAEAGTYTLSFDYSPRLLNGQIAETSVLNIWVNGVMIDSITSGTLGYTRHTFTFQLNAGVNTIGFSGGGTDDTYGALVDNVSLQGLHPEASDTAFVDVTINGEGSVADLLPTARADAIVVNELGTDSVNILANDTAGDGATALVGVLAPNGAAIAFGTATAVATAFGTAFVTVAADGTVTLDASSPAFLAMKAGDVAAFDLTYTVRDADGDLSTATVTMTINGLNEGPDAVDDANAGTEAVGSITGTVLANDTDPNGDAIAVVSAGGQAVGTALAVSGVSSEGRALSGTLTVNADGTYSFVPAAGYGAMKQGETVQFSTDYTIRDVHGATDTATLTITVNGVNEGPDAVNDAASGIETVAGLSGNLLLNDSDPNGEALVVTSAGGVAPGTAFAVSGVSTEGRALSGMVTVGSDGAWSFVPDAGYGAMKQGESVTFTAGYTIEDPHGATDSATLTIRIDGVNEGPLAAPDENYGFEDVPALTGNVLDNDVDPNAEAITVTGFGGVAAGETVTLTQDLGDGRLLEATLTIGADGSYTFTPVSGFEALDQGEVVSFSVDYAIADVHGAPATSTLTIDIEGTDDGGGGGTPLPAINLAFVVDVSASMFTENGIFLPVDIFGDPPEVFPDVNGDGLDGTQFDLAFWGVKDFIAEVMASAAPGQAVNISLTAFDDSTVQSVTYTGAASLAQWGLDVVNNGNAGASKVLGGLQSASTWLTSVGATAADENHIVVLSDGQLDTENGAVEAFIDGLSDVEVHARYTGTLDVALFGEGDELMAGLNDDDWETGDIFEVFGAYDQLTMETALEVSAFWNA